MTDETDGDYVDSYEDVSKFHLDDERERALLPAGKKAEKPAVKKKRRSSRT